jgi:hypothetical protein
MNLRDEERKQKIKIIKETLFPERDIPDNCDLCGAKMMRVGHGEGKARAKGHVKLIEDTFDILQWYLCKKCTSDLIEHLVGIGLENWRKERKNNDYTECNEVRR